MPAAVRFAATSLAAALLVPACGGRIEAPEPGPPAPIEIREGMTRDWVYNTFESETWREAWEEVALRGSRPSERVLRRGPPAEMVSLLGATPRVTLDVSADAIRILREGLQTVDVRLDGGAERLGKGDARVEVVGFWRDDAVQLHWDFGEGRVVHETWRLAETGERVLVERRVDIPGRRPLYVTFVQVYDRDRSDGGRR